MKHFFKSILLWLGCSGLALGQPVAVFNNYGVIDAVTNISAVHFNNFGSINFDTGSLKLYNTYNTAYYTSSSSSTMTSEPGFRFADVTASSIVPAVSFINRGVITGVDVPAGITFFFGSSGSYIIPNDNQLVPSKLIIQADNVVNTGTLAVGDGGTMNISGANMDLSYGTIAAGNLLSTNESSIADSEAAETYEAVPGETPLKLYMQDAAGTYDLLWGATNGLMASVVNLVIADTNGDGFYTLQLPLPPGTTNRNGNLVFGNIIASHVSAFVYQYAKPPGQTTNIYYDVVFINTNFPDPNMSVNVGFASNLFGFNYVPPQPMTGNANGIPILVTFSERETDAVSGAAVTNSVYLEDDGDTLNPVTLAQNADYVQAYSRPDAFEVTLTPPPRIPPADFAPPNTVFNLGNIYTPGEMANVVSMTNSVYEAQIGRNPESLSGVFTDLTGLETFTADIPDVTNAPGRITINAGNLNLHDSKLSAEGLLTLTAANVTGLPAVFNFGTADISLGAPTHQLLVSNLVPVLFEQLRGNLEGWEGTWDNMQTNTTATNDIHTHVLYVGESLSALYTPTIRRFTLRSPRMFLQDNVQVIQNAIFNGADLTINAAVHLTQGAANLSPSGTPNLQNLLITTNGSFTVDSLLDIGFPLPVTVTSPIGRTYSVATITNQGSIFATAPTFKALRIEDDGLIEAFNGGSVVLEAGGLGMGFSGNSVNEILAGGTVTLSANGIKVTNSTIDANGLVLTAVSELTDFVGGTLGTNIVDGASDLVNFWTVTNELELTRKPVAGDLYGTQIHVIAQEGPPTTVTWAGADRGDSINGFINNTVVGHLVLDRLTAPAVLQFRAAGPKNALYVNYLELADASLSDYRDNLLIDPHLKIYFASANVPFNKVTNISSQLVFATNALAAYAGSPSPLLRRALLATAGTGGSEAAVAEPPAGVYAGLFAPANGVVSGNSGLVTFTLEKNGTYSGRLWLGSTVTPFSSTLDDAGMGTFSLEACSVDFSIDSAGNLLGEVTADGWNAELSGEVTPTWTAAHPSPYAGKYVMTLPGPGGSAPSAASVVNVTVGPAGAVVAAGRLADGVAFSQSTHVSEDGQWPLFAETAAGKDELLGWLNFSADPRGLSGNVTWIKPPQAAGAYPAGFDVTVQIVGTAGK